MSLRARLLALVLLATLLPALVLGWRFVRENNAQIAAAVKTLSTSASNLAHDLDHRVQGTAQLHFGLAHSRVLDGGDRASCSAYLSQVREAYPQYTGILTVLPNGQLHCDSLRTGRELDLNDRTYVKRVLAGDTGLIVEPAIGRLTGTSVLQVVYPALDAVDHVRFMLVASINLEKFVQEEQQRSLLEQAELLLVDRQGTVLVWSGVRDGLAKPGSSIAGTPMFELAQQAGSRGATGELMGPDGQAQVWAVAATAGLADTGLHVMVGQPRDTLVAVARLRLRQGLIVLCTAALLLFTGVWFLSEWGIRRQVGRITAMAQGLGAGDLGARIAQPHPRGELGGLMAVLNTTAGSLQRQREAIDELGLRLREAHMHELLESEENEARLFRMANFDGLTGLPNRTLFRDRLQQAIARSRRSGRPFALMFLDIDRFKTINDSLGHDIGDRLLVAVAGVLAGCVRATDSLARGSDAASPEAVFRLGGDEFTILTEDLADTSSVKTIAERILAALNQPFMIEEHELFTSASIGIALYDGHEDTDMDGLIKQADIAMYRSKELGRDTYFFFDAELDKASSVRHQLESSLRHALERDEFVLHYQPKVDIITGLVTGVEALMRWQPTGQAMVGPDKFIPILEETGLIVGVGAWAFRHACAQMMDWQRRGMRPLRLAVNLSARQFRHQDLVGQIAGVLADTGFAPGLLEIELTETMLIDDTEAVLAIMKGLGAMGVSIAIDDFGTGHSSLSYLKRFDVDTLKIDRSFIKDTPDDAEDSAIAIAVIALGHGLGLKVVAEGVETPAQVDFLRAQGCDELQGYLISRPVDAPAFANWFAEREAQALAVAI
ncbi:MAG: EAL domain-containing protein [Burkholderiales bacterium]|nr:EAL domain-containing protein [Burkholderiales bacterium]